MSDPKTPDIEPEETTSEETTTTDAPADEPSASDDSPSLAETPSAEGGQEDDPVVEHVVFPDFETDGTPSEASSINRVLDVRLTLSVELGRREMLVQDVLKVGQGSVVDLQKNASAPVDILVNGKLLARGEVVVVDECFGVRVTQLVDPVERVRRIA